MLRLTKTEIEDLLTVVHNERIIMEYPENKDAFKDYAKRLIKLHNKLSIMRNSYYKQ